MRATAWRGNLQHLLASPPAPPWAGTGPCRNCCRLLPWQLRALRLVMSRPRLSSPPAQEFHGAGDTWRCLGFAVVPLRFAGPFGSDCAGDHDPSFCHHSGEDRRGRLPLFLPSHSISCRPVSSAGEARVPLCGASPPGESRCASCARRDAGNNPRSRSGSRSRCRCRCRWRAPADSSRQRHRGTLPHAEEHERSVLPPLA